MMCNARHSTSASVANSTIRSHSYHFGASMKHDARLWRTCKMPTRVLSSTSTDGQSLAGRSTSESLQTESHAVLENGKSSDNVIKLSPKNLTSTIYQLSRYDMHSNASSCPPKKIKKEKSAHGWPATCLVKSCAWKRDRLPDEVQEPVETPSVCKRPSVWGRYVHRPVGGADHWRRSSCCCRLDDWAPLRAARLVLIAVHEMLRRATLHSPRRSFSRPRPWLNLPHLTATSKKLRRVIS